MEQRRKDQIYEADTAHSSSSPGKKKKFEIGLRLSLWNLLAAGAVLIAALVFYIVEFVPLSLEESPTGWLRIYGWYTAVYWGLTALGIILCLIELRIADKVRYGLGWSLLIAVPFGTFFAVDIINGTRIFSFSTMKAFANYICYLMVFMLFYAIFRRVWAAVLAGGIVFLVFGIANYFVVQFRGQPILPWDIQSFSTALGVSGGYEYVPTRQMALAVLAFICLIALCVKLGPRGGRDETSRSFRLAERCTSMGIAIVLLILVFPLNILSNMGVSVWAWNQKTSSELTGITAGFFANIQFVMVDKPQGYSPQAVKELSGRLEEQEEPSLLGSPEKLPTIVAIMNESLTDFQNVGEITFQPDNLPFIHSLANEDNVIWGTAYSSVYGGNTCNSEYEFLTGNTTAFLPSGSKPYQQYVKEEQTALPAILKGYGYRSVAIHPGNRGAWSRDTAYPYLGFEEFIDVSAFDVRRSLVHRLTSDASTYEQVKYEYENREEGQPLFLFDVTIQNHGGYEDEDFQNTVSIQQAAGEFPQAEQYLSLTQRSDEDIQELLEYFSRQEDPVVVLFFGDHWPNLESEFVDMLLGTEGDSLSFENLMRQYQVPFFIWANYPLEGEEIQAVSLNYLSGLLLRAAGIEGTEYTKFLEDLRQTLPVITAVGYIDKDGNIYKNGERTPYEDLLREYAILQYNNAFGASEKLGEVFLP